MTKAKKYYVVWVGRKTGIFSSWDKCYESVYEFPQARYKSFESKIEAEQAFNNPHYDYFKTKDKDKKTLFKPNTVSERQNILGVLKNTLPVMNSLCVDAACSGNPGVMEYQGIHILSGKRIFYYKYPYGTNNIGEFLALVHGLSYLKRHNLSLPLYSDSINAIKWVKQKKCKTKLVRNEKTKELFDYIKRAEIWLENNDFTTEIIKWDTESWGEIPADFGRKK